jgi:hypothetical protein
MDKHGAEQLFENLCFATYSFVFFIGDRDGEPESALADN